ncbi:MAG: gamma-glutamyl-gamma-aminobutyrate hydrolase family protein, partial [Candidatus Omnitrophica bacterium]|nr:gamma-glutamyl-gamma-aminobutyrate hydrolase family protein [Candidatus Omnitrophota bacterium]
HSLVIDKETLPKNLIVTAYTEDGTIMAIKEKNYDLWGVQFHPESILTTEGKKILSNFLNL